MEVALIKFNKLGVDLGSRYIKIASLIQNEEGQPIIDNYTVYDAVGTIGERAYFKGFKQNIKDFIKAYDMDGITMSITISAIDDVTTSTLMTLPSRDEKVLKKAVKFEVEEDELVDNLANHYMVWEALDDVDDEEGYNLDISESHLIVTTVKKNIIYELAQIRKLKWKIENIELQFRTIGRLTQGISAVIDFGHDSTRLYLYEDGELIRMERVSDGGQALTEKIRKESGIDLTVEAEKLKHQGFVVEDEDDFTYSSEVPRNVIDLITDESYFVIDEIKQLIRGYELSDMMTIEHMYYTGAGSRLTNFSDILTAEFDGAILPLGIKHPIDDSEESNEWDEVEDDVFILEDEDKEESDSTSAVPSVEVLMMAYSAAQFDTEEYYSTFNYAKFLKYNFDVTSILIAVAFMALVLNIGVGFVNEKYDEDIADIRTAQVQQEQTGDELQRELGAASQQKSSMTAFISRIEGLSDVKNWFSDVLYILPGRTPHGIVVQNINIVEDEIKLYGFSADYSNIGFFAKELSVLGDVEIMTIETLDDEGVFLNPTESTDEPGAGPNMSHVYEITIQTTRFN